MKIVAGICVIIILAKEDTKVIEEATKISRQQKTKNGVKFLLSNETLDKEEVGDYLSAFSSILLTQKEHGDLLSIFVGLLDFSAMTFDSAFRYFLLDGAFRLPKEAGKIDRLVETFATRYFNDNPSMFRNSGEALVLCYGVLMLNTELHNPKARAATARNKEPMTKEQFVKMVTHNDNDDNINLSEAFLHDLYDPDVQSVQKQFRTQCNRSIQRAQAKLREII